MKNKDIKGKYKRNKNIEIEDEQHEGNRTEQNNIKEKRETKWIKLLEEELEKFSLGESEDENQVMPKNEEIEMGEIQKDKIIISSNTDKKDNIEFNSNKEKRTSKKNEKNKNFENVNDEITKFKKFYYF